MSKRSELMSAVLAAADRFDSPDASMHARVWASVEQRVDAGDPGPAIADASAPAIGAGASWLTPLRVLLVVGAVGLGAGVIALARGGDDDAVAEEQVAVEPVASPPITALVEPRDEPPAVVPAPARAATPEPAETIEIHAPDEKPRRSTPTRAEPSPDASDSLGAEVELLRRARAAANAGRHADALAILKDHAKRFPRGKLARERDMSRLKAYCALGKSGDAKKLAASMLSGDRSDVLRAKLEKTCAGSIE